MNKIAKMFDESCEAYPERSRYKWGCVYFVSCGNMIKIGESSNLYNRLRNLRNSNPREIKLLAKIDTPSKEAARDLESKIHAEFDEIRVHNEWFKKTRELTSFVKEAKRFGDKLEADRRRESARKMDEVMPHILRIERSEIRRGET